MKKNNFFFITFIILTASIIIPLNCRNSGRQSATLQELDIIVDTYCSHVAEGRYREAYNECLNAQYRKDISLDDFISSHEKRKKELGIPVEKTRTYDKENYNIFSGVKEYQLTYELKYANATHHEHIKLNNEDGSFLIEGTYTSSSSKTLRFMIW
ncbi:MAG TPA: hypothetical protein PK514_09095 [Spirochaetota bacterium]|nr:hypothetical protein [Spirochaetota bacterium]